MNRPVTGKEIELTIKKSTNKEKPRLFGFAGEFH